MSAQSLLYTAVLLWATVTLGQADADDTRKGSNKTYITGKDTERLLQHIKNITLGKDILPTDGKHEGIKVLIGMALIYIDSLDEASSTLHLDVWMRYLWRDYYLQWEPDDFNGINDITFPKDYVWSSDITLFNKKEEIKWSTTSVVTSYNGDIFYIPMAQLSSHCQLDYTNFPFDTQTCSLTFGSLMYAGNKVDLDLYGGLDQIDTSDYSSNKQWDVINTAAKRTVKYYPCCPEPYPSITFNLTIKRKSSPYIYTYVGPAIVLSLLVPFIFLLPPGDPQKMTLGGSILLVFPLFFLEMFMTLPSVQSNTPLIDKYYMTIYLLLCATMALSTFSSNISKQETIQSMHMVVQKVLNFLARCMCVSRTIYTDIPTKDEHVNKITDTICEGQDGVQKAPIKKWLLISSIIDRLFFLVYLVFTIVLAVTMFRAHG